MTLDLFSSPQFFGSADYLYYPPNDFLSSLLNIDDIKPCIDESTPYYVRTIDVFSDYSTVMQSIQSTALVNIPSIEPITLFQDTKPEDFLSPKGQKRKISDQTKNVLDKTTAAPSRAISGAKCPRKTLLKKISSEEDGTRIALGTINHNEVTAHTISVKFQDNFQNLLLFEPKSVETIKKVIEKQKWIYRGGYISYYDDPMEYVMDAALLYQRFVESSPNIAKNELWKYRIIAFSTAIKCADDVPLHLGDFLNVLPVKLDIGYFKKIEMAFLQAIDWKINIQNI